MSNGVVYVATGERFVQRARTSVASLRAAMPSTPITVFSDIPFDETHVQNVLIESSPYHYFDKICYMARAPYLRTIFLDADTFVSGDFSEVFDLLDRFDIAAAHDTYRFYVQDFETVREVIEEIPESFPILNSGVIAYRKSDGVDKFFETWLALHQRNLQITPSGGTDQLAFREALYFSDLHLTVLPNEYNCRFVSPVFVNREIKILHGPHTNFPSLEREVNRIIENRVFLPKMGTFGDIRRPVLVGRWFWVEAMRQMRVGALRIGNRLKRKFGFGKTQ